MKRRPRRLPPRGVGPRRCVQRARRGVAPDGGMQGGARGVEGVAGDPAGDGAVRRICTGGERQRGVETESGDTTVGAHACSCERTHQPYVLRGEGRPRRPRWSH